MTKKWYESKTLWFSILTIAIGIAAGFGFGEFAPDAAQSEQIEAITVVIIGVIGLVLRLVTENAIEK